MFIRDYNGLRDIDVSVLAFSADPSRLGLLLLLTLEDSDLLLMFFPS